MNHEEKVKKFRQLEREYIDQFPEDGKEIIDTLKYAVGIDETYDILAKRRNQKIEIIINPQADDDIDYIFS